MAKTAKPAKPNKPARPAGAAPSRALAGAGAGTSDHRNRNLAIAAGTALVAGGAALIGIFARRREGLIDGLIERVGGAPALPAGHAVPDLEGADHPGPDSRAPEHFRPDPTAPVAPEDREALRPA